MRVIKVSNVNTAIRVAGPLLAAAGLWEESRNGRVLVYPEPVTTVYMNPDQRVLLWPNRRANPFFHLAESLWMIGGNNDAAFLNRYVRDFGERYAEHDGLLHGAYGHRWRNWFYHDQLDWAVDLLKKDSTSRRCVIAMWDPDTDHIQASKDIPCNTHIYVRVNGGKLDLTVLCRSNDVVWGAYGANAVHMSVLQEYLAWRLNLPIGRMFQVSNNFHIYESTLHMLPKTAAEAAKVEDPYTGADAVACSPLFKAEANDAEFCAALDHWIKNPTEIHPSYEVGSVFKTLLVPMERTHLAIKAADWGTARREMDAIIHEDWRAAARQVYDRRFSSWQKKENVA